MQIRPKPARVKSPCVNVCVMDEDSGYCHGCKRTLDEIAGWVTFTDAQRRAVIVQLDGREVADSLVLPTAQPGERLLSGQPISLPPGSPSTQEILENLRGDDLS